LGHPSPVGLHLLLACGAAWGMQLDGENNVVYASLGDTLSTATMTAWVVAQAMAKYPRCLRGARRSTVVRS